MVEVIESGYHIKGKSFSVIIPFGLVSESFESLTKGLFIPNRDEVLKDLNSKDEDYKRLQESIKEVVRTESKGTDEEDNVKPKVKRSRRKKQHPES